MRRSKEELQRLRAAKGRNREARLRRWKDNTKTVPPYLQALWRQRANFQQALAALANALKPAIKQITELYRTCSDAISWRQ